MRKSWLVSLATLTLVATWLAEPCRAQIAVLDQVTLERKGHQTVTFQVPELPAGRDAVLVLRARLESPVNAGYTQALGLSLNAAAVGGSRLLQRPVRAKTRGGVVTSLVQSDKYVVFYGPDFTKPDDDPNYGLQGGIKTCDFQWRVTDLLKVGSNTLEFEHAGFDGVLAKLVVAQGRIEFREPVQKTAAQAAAASGPLPVIEPRPVTPTDYQVDSATVGQLRVRIAGEEFLVTSQFSTPQPAWVTGSNRYFRHERRLERRPEAIVVYDTFTNLTDEKLALMQRHEAVTSGGFAHVWLAGLERQDQTGSQSDPSNPTSFAATTKGGLGLLPLSDAFRIHIDNSSQKGKIAIADRQCVLRPGASYTAEWAIVPVEEPDYWRILNATRRLLDANFTTPGGFAFFRPELNDKWNDEQTRQFLECKDVLYACATLPYWGKDPCQGTVFQRMERDNFRKAFERRRQLAPAVKNLIYFHCFLDVSDEGPKQFADSRILLANGQQADYGEATWRLFVPTESNSYGPAITKNIDLMLGEIGADGIFWDEHEYSRFLYHYGDSWDGISGDIDATKMTVSRLKSSVTLLTEPWRLALARRILAHGPLIGNGPPITRAMAALKFPCFVETGSISNCTQAHLHSPIALGDHLTEQSELDAYRTMLDALDYGCVYHWYNDLSVIPTYKTLTSYMFPMTPLELHEGYLIGQERIITRRSGRYGWGDASQHELHVFDQDGREVPNFSAPHVEENGKSYTELRMPENWSAAIVRR